LIAKQASTFVDAEGNVQKAFAIPVFMNSLNAYTNASLQSISDPVNRTIGMASSAYLLSPYFDEFATYAPEEFDKFASNAEVKRGIEVAIDTLTEATPNDLQTAFENAS